jgi:hypothetical protein
MVVPSHFIPLAAPGMVSLGLKWMWNPESPFYIRPRLDPDLVSWGLRFWRAATRPRVEAAAPVLRDLGLLSRECFTSMGLDFGLVEKGLLMLCKEERTLEEESHAAAKAKELGIPAEVLDARATAASTLHGATDAPRRGAAQCRAAYPRDAACCDGGTAPAANRGPSGRSSGGASSDSSRAHTDSSSHRQRGRRRHTKRAGDRRSAGRGTRHPRTGRSGRHPSADRTAADTAAAMTVISPH